MDSKTASPDTAKSNQRSRHEIRTDDLSSGVVRARRREALPTDRIDSEPNSPNSDRQAQRADWAESALRAALPVSEESLRFSLAIHGMIKAAAIKMAIPR
jgi:hypothetical protein